MSESQVLTVVAVCAPIVAVSMMVIAWCAMQALSSARNLERRLEAVLSQWEPVAGEVSRAVKEFNEQTGELLTRLNDLTTRLHQQTVRAESVFGEVGATVSQTFGELERVVQSTMQQVGSAVDSLERTVRAPVMKLRAFVGGVSAAVRHFAGGRRQASPDRVPADEEMFI